MHNPQLSDILERFPRAHIGYFPTPLERLDNLGARLGTELWIKRDDCAGFGFGGNKVRQLDFYFGAAQQVHADTVLITGAVQSNFVRTTASIANKLGMSCHIQLEERVRNPSELYRNNGNVVLNKLLGATLYSYPDGEDEAGADARLHEIAAELKASAKRPYVIPLGQDSAPLGALGYVLAAQEILKQMPSDASVKHIVVASGSALTHAGLLYGLRLLGSSITVHGICVRREHTAQQKRVLQRLHDINELTGASVGFTSDDVITFDGALSPGYGHFGEDTLQAVEQTARFEGIFLDPVYTGKTMDGLIKLHQLDRFNGETVLFWHTGGTPALFAYADQLTRQREHG